MPGTRRTPAGQADDLDGGGGHAEAGDRPPAAAAGQAAEQDPGRGEQGRAVVVSFRAGLALV
jgi:hypothetical protein